MEERNDELNSEEMLEKFISYINNDYNFTIVRYGDGEFQNMTSTNEDDKNCDDCNYYIELGKLLTEAYIYFLNEKDTYISIWNEKHLIERELNIYKNTPNNFLKNEIITNKIIDPFGEYPFGKVQQFFFAIKNSKKFKIYISNKNNIKHISGVLKSDINIEIPETNAFLEKDNIEKVVLNTLKEYKNCIVILSGGMYIKCLIRKLKKYYDNTYIDIGSSLDGIHKYSRDFNDNMIYRKLINDAYSS